VREFRSCAPGVSGKDTQDGHNFLRQHRDRVAADVFCEGFLGLLKHAQQIFHLRF